MKRRYGIAKNKEMLTEGILYIIFGVLTTSINIMVFTSINLIGISYVYSNIIAFLISVIFAFYTNKLYVFKSIEWKGRGVVREFLVFFMSRIATFVIDMGSMLFLVEVICIGNIISKVIVNIVVIMLNYIISKLIIFKN